MKEQNRALIARRFATDEEVDSVIREAIRMAVAEHRQRGNWIAIWRNGCSVTLRANELPEELNEGDGK